MVLNEIGEILIPMHLIIYSKLESAVIAKGNVEVWIGDLLREQQKSLHGVIRDAWRNIITPEFELMGFLANFPAQVKLVFALKQNTDFNSIVS